MKLRELLNEISYKRIVGDAEIDIKNLEHKSEEPNKNGVYFCLRGSKIDGHNFYDMAIKNGAVCLVTDRELPAKVTQVVVEDTREAMALMAGNFYGNPIRSMKLVTITGTNGKTTSSYILKQIFKDAGKNVGLIGTTANFINEVMLPSHLTTPDPIELHELFSKMKNAGVDIIVMEASAHAIALKKLAGVTADVGIFTNLTQDHLDFFENFETYANTKINYFCPQNVKHAVVNIDDANGRKIEPKIGYGMENISGLKLTEHGSTYTWKGVPISFALPGRFNVYNSLAAAECANVLGIDKQTIAKGIANVRRVAGRFNVINAGDFSVIIDYAHTPDGLENILQAISEFCKGRIITVFGCGGNRDKTKRPIMGKIVSKNSDFTIVTSDNPRFEKPEDIISDVIDGVAGKHYAAVVNRSEAIMHALNMAKAGDIVLLAGKGAEDYIDINGVKKPYSDEAEVKKHLENLLQSKGKVKL